MKKYTNLSVVQEDIGKLQIKTRKVAIAECFDIFTNFIPNEHKRLHLMKAIGALWQLTDHDIEIEVTLKKPEIIVLN